VKVEVRESKRITQVAVTLAVGLAIAIFASACLGKTRSNSSQESICDSLSYAEALEEYDGGPETIAHFPPSIPVQAKQVSCQYERRFLQGGPSLRVSYKLSVSELEVLQEQYRSVAKRIEDGVPFRIPEGFEVFYLSDSDSPDWNGYIYGVAISVEHQEVIYWVEDVRT
jgi:hypothetical protein